MFVLGLVLMLLGFLLATASPFRDWKILFGLALFVIGDLFIILTILT